MSGDDFGPWPTRDEIRRDEERRAQVRLAEELRLARRRAESRQNRPSGPTWMALVRAYREWLTRPGNADARPSQDEIAAELHRSSRTLVRQLRALGIPSWRAVHDLVLSEP